MAVEEYGCSGLQVLQEGQACAELVNEEGIGLKGGEFAVSVDGDEEV